MASLNGKVALITGASRGIGAAIARRLAGEGAKVLFTYARSDDLARALASEIALAGGAARALKADSAHPSAMAAVMEELIGEFGRIDILVNNAGIFSVKPIDAFSVEDFDHYIAVNVRAVFLAIKAAAPFMSAGGRIVTIGSNLAERAPGGGMALYSMSKAALIGLTKGAARDLGPRGITVNVVQPGSTDTDMNPANGPHADRQRALRAIPAYNSADEVAGLVAYLVSDEARSVTGATFTIDGGANI